MGFFKKIFGGARANFCSSTGLSNRSLTRIDKRFKQEKAKRQDRKKKKKIKRVEYRPHQTIVHFTPNWYQLFLKEMYKDTQAAKEPNNNLGNPSIRLSLLYPQREYLDEVWAAR